jgi:ribonuclease P protein component
VHYLAKSPGTQPRIRDATANPPQPDTAGPTAAPCGDDEAAPVRVWLGLVVPKRHARKAVTRTLLKRRIRTAFAGRPDLARGMWVVRLRTPFARTEFLSAASDKLSAAVTEELTVLMTAAARAPR